MILLILHLNQTHAETLEDCTMESLSIIDQAVGLNADCVAVVHDDRAAVFKLHRCTQKFICPKGRFLKWLWDRDLLAKWDRVMALRTTGKETTL